MSFSRGRTSPFLKRVLIPCWVLRLALIVTELVLTGIIINYLAAHQYVPGFGNLLAVHCALEAVLAIGALLDIICLVTLALKTLTPLMLFATNLFQAATLLIIFCICWVRAFTTLDAILNSLILLMCVAILGYSSFVFHKHRRGTLPGSYERTDDLSESQKLVVPTGYRLGQSETYESRDVTEAGRMALSTEYHSPSEKYEPYRPQSTQPAESHTPFSTTDGDLHSTRLA